MTTAIRRVLALFAILVGAGCMHAPIAKEPGYWISSDSSLYSPAARMRVGAQVMGGKVRVHVYAGTLTVPGELMANSPPLMSDLYLTALLATSGSSVASVDGKASSDRRAWRLVAASDSALVAKEIRYGETLPVSPLTLEVPLTTAPADRPLWIVYRIRGKTVEMLPPDHPGGSPIRRPGRSDVLVYACGDRDIRGRRDSERSAGLREAYGISC
jgi:hypothetical protein